jgi:macrolide transport system ATP-binding/permease protein
MKRFRALVLRLAGLFGGARRERELADELESHLQMNIDDNLRAGLTQEEARRQAMLRLGGVEKTTQAYRERGTLPLVENVVGDLRFAVRQLVKHPGFAATAIVVLALGIGASVAIFGFVDAALLEPLPYTNPRQ